MLAFNTSVFSRAGSSAAVVTTNSQLSRTLSYCDKGPNLLLRYS